MWGGGGWLSDNPVIMTSFMMPYICGLNPTSPSHFIYLSNKNKNKKKKKKKKEKRKRYAQGGFRSDRLALY